MKKIFYFAMSLPLLCCALLSFNIRVRACDTPETTYSPASTYLYVIKNADVIVRATAIEAVENQATKFTGVKFKVEEVIKGEEVPSTITFFGHLTDKDNYNERVAPYNGVRLAGSNYCYAHDYKRGAEFLLFLRKSKGQIVDPYWKPFAPTNEQLHPDNDKWLEWVKNNLK